MTGVKRSLVGLGCRSEVSRLAAPPSPRPGGTGISMFSMDFITPVLQLFSRHSLLATLSGSFLPSELIIIKAGVCVMAESNQQQCSLQGAIRLQGESLPRLPGRQPLHTL